MSYMIRILLLAFMLNISSNTLSAQDPPNTSLWQIETVDGNSFMGKITQQDSEKIVFEIQNFGTMTILRSAIKRIVEVKPENVVGGEYYFSNPHASRYFFGPNGYGLKKTEAYYENTWIMFNQLSYGFHDYFTVGVGIMPLFFFGGASTPVWITPKVQFPVIEDKLNIGGGVLLSTILGEGESFGITYGVATYGSLDHNITFGLGYGFSSNGWANAPTLSLAGMTRVSAKTYLMTDHLQR